LNEPDLNLSNTIRLRVARSSETGGYILFLNQTSNKKQKQKYETWSGNCIQFRYGEWKLFLEYLVEKNEEALEEGELPDEEETDDDENDDDDDDGDDDDEDENDVAGKDGEKNDGKDDINKQKSNESMSHKALELAIDPITDLFDEESLHIALDNLDEVPDSENFSTICPTLWSNIFNENLVKSSVVV